MIKEVSLKQSQNPPVCELSLKKSQVKAKKLSFQQAEVKREQRHACKGKYFIVKRLFSGSVSRLSIDAYLNINLRLFLLSFLVSHRIIFYLIIHITLSVYGFQNHMSEPLKEKNETRKRTPAALNGVHAFTHNTYKTIPVSPKQNIWITFTLR